MSSTAKGLGTVLTVAAAVSMPITLGVRAPAVPAGAVQASMSDRAKFVGTYRLITTEVKDAASGKWSQTPNFHSIGYITYADTSHMGVHIMPRNRPLFAANPPTAEEARAALRGYAAYFGSFTVGDKEKFVVHHRFTGNVLRLGGPPTLTAAGEMAGGHLYWDRLPPIE